MSKDTLQLPKTAFSMKANLPIKELEILKKWENNKIFEKLRKSSKGKEKFILHDGPPYANGHIHMGTALNKILKDIITRFHQMDGKDSIYVPGWDCHGLPIEWKIEEQYKKKKKNKDEVPIQDFRQECREFAKSWIDVHIKEFKRLGVVGDFDNYYSTMSYEAEAQIVRELGKFLLDESLYQGFKPVLWSTVEKTALADAEVEYMDHTSNTIYVAFKVKETNKDFLKDACIIIWTTTPWTIPANKALAFNSNIEYSVLEINELENFKEKKIVVAKNLINEIVNQCEIKNFKELKSFKGSEFKETICIHPFYKLGFDYNVPMLDAQFVNLDQGTGIVHCAPSHGPDDFNLCLKNNIPSLYTVDNAGLYTNEIPYFTKTHIFKADPIVIEKLKEQNKLLKNDKLNHSYPHSWRSKAPLIYRATPQWFISMKKNDLRNKAIKAINETIFYPNKGKDRLLSMVEGRPDWCVSRQRVWGVPLPIFINKKTKEPLRDQKVIDRIASIYEKQGSDCWFIENPKFFLGEEYNSDDYEKLNDIVEVWFDSGSTHSFVLEKRKDLKWPADMYLEGSDQHRGWFHSSLLESCGTRGKAPFKSILSHGFVVDGKGMKMSKSTGNVISPEDILKNYGADILRIWVAASDYAEDLRIDKSILTQHAESYRKIRNTFRFILGNLKDEFKKQDFNELNLKEFDELEQYILHRIYHINNSVKNNLKNYNFHKLYKELLNFCTLDLSSFYFDIRKDSLYCDNLTSKKRKNCVIVLNIILESLLKWFAPILVFTTDEIYSLISVEEKKSIHEHTFVKVPKNWENEKLNEKWEQLFKIKQEVNIAIEEKRASKEIGSSLEAEIKLTVDKRNFELLKNLDLAEYFITSKAEKLLSEKNKMKIGVDKAKGTKCPRCWKIIEKNCERCSKLT
ncbi:MAG: isoleucine--tRNA ligase [Candidatus Pelagibacter bacterium]|nr:isoleucine--tRNA ligase [Candidatus Pelagibacter bacterium]MBL6861138.1 isoleucine--tRNA ligase [Candidatus Pelagibacter bacterium]